MAKYLFLGSKFQSFKDDGSVNASGTVEFFAVGGAFSTYVSSYTDSTLATANSNTITLDAAGRADIWLNDNVDVRVKDSSGTTIDTALSINPSVTETVEGDNLVANPSFETDEEGDDVPDDWTVATYTGGTAAIDSTDSSHGTNSMKFVSAGNGGGNITSESFFPVSPSTRLFVNFDLKSTADVRNLMQVLWYDRSQVALGSPSDDLYDDSATNPTSWTRKFTSVAVPSTAYFAKLKFFGAHSSDATSGTVRIDNIKVTTVPELGQGLEGAAVASASTTEIWAQDGTTRHITGTTTITSFGTAPQAGAFMRLIFDDAVTLTHAANLNLPGAANYTTVAGQMVLVYADTTTQFDVFPVMNGAPVVGTTGTFTGAITATGGQIVFPATQVPSAGANTLDDYEEESWTPVLTFATPGDLAVVYSVQSGSYTKIGRQVIAKCSIVTSTFTHTTAANDLRVTGLPFATGGVDATAGAVLWSGITKANYTSVVARPESSHVAFIASGSAVAAAAVTAADCPTTGAMNLSFTVSYNV